MECCPVLSMKAQRCTCLHPKCWITLRWCLASYLACAPKSASMWHDAATLQEFPAGPVDSSQPTAVPAVAASMQLPLSPAGRCEQPQPVATSDLRDPESDSDERPFAQLLQSDGMGTPPFGAMPVPLSHTSGKKRLRQSNLHDVLDPKKTKTSSASGSG